MGPFIVAKSYYSKQNVLVLNTAPCLCRGRIALGFPPIRSIGCFMSLLRPPPIHCCRQTNASRGSIKRHCHFVLLRAYRVLELQMNHLFQMHARMRSLLVREKDIERSSTSFAFNTFLAEIGSQLPSNVRSSGPHAKNKAQRKKNQTGSRLLQSQYFTISWG